MLPAQPLGSALCPLRWNRLRSRRSDPSERTVEHAKSNDALGWAGSGGEPRHGYPWVRRDFPLVVGCESAAGDPTDAAGCSASDPVSLHWAARVHLLAEL